MEKKQTAVEWYWNQIAETLPFKVDSATAVKMYDKFQQALQMEREQHGITWDSAIDQNQRRGFNCVRTYDDFDQYYAETYCGSFPIRG